MNERSVTRIGCIAIGVLLVLGRVPDSFSWQSDASVVPGPSFKKVLSLRSIGGPVISWDGLRVAYTVRSTDWEENRYDTEIWVVSEEGEPVQFTRTESGSSHSPQWSPDGRWIAFLTKRDEKQQIFLIGANGGEAFPVTRHSEDVRAFRWSPDGTEIVYSSVDTLDHYQTQTKAQYGDFEIDDEEKRMTHLWRIPLKLDEPAEGERLTSGADFTVGSFHWSPDGSKIAFDHRPDPLITSWGKSDISVLDVETGRITPLVTQEGPDTGPVYSPDGKWIAFESSMEEPFYYYANTEIARVPARGGKIEVLTETFDEDPSVIRWTDEGIYFIANQRWSRALFCLQPDNDELTRVLGSPEIILSADITPDGRMAALSASDRLILPEIFITSISEGILHQLTQMTEQVAGWDLGTREIVEWKSRDGARIEGILWKPDGFDPDIRRPLLVSIHGGPTGTSRPVLVESYVYPYLQWLARGALILQPNYRGSSGYGEEFRSLNVRNLGVGDGWDVESGVDYLVEEGWVDPDRVGAMGWSQGGYISAFLSTHSDKFKAISVGAGISNWVTYYVNTDIHPFTRQYLKATPWEDMEIYRKTSPMTAILKASTPTLIQHGEFDRRVPIPNAYELLQGLRDMGVETRLIVYKGFGHGITKPKERLAAVWHNWAWFSKYIWGEAVHIPVDE